MGNTLELNLSSGAVGSITTEKKNAIALSHEVRRKKGSALHGGERIVATADGPSVQQQLRAILTANAVSQRQGSEGEERPACCKLRAASCVLQAACSLLRAACCVQPAACSLLRAACCVQPVACSLLLVCCEPPPQRIRLRRAAAASGASIAHPPAFCTRRAVAHPRHSDWPCNDGSVRWCCATLVVSACRCE